MSEFLPDIPLQYREAIGLDNLEPSFEGEEFEKATQALDQACREARKLSPEELAKSQAALHLCGMYNVDYEEARAMLAEEPASQGTSLNKVIDEVVSKVVDQMLAKDASGGKLAKSCVCKRDEPITVGDLVKCGSDGSVCRVVSSQNGLIDFVSLDGRSHGRAIGKYVQRA